MFSLHIDTARTWRGGQSQVRYTVLGLRALGHRAALVADPAGELFQRMSEGLDLIPLATRNEIDLAAAWRLSRVLKQLRPDVIHAHDPGGVAMAATALSITAPRPRPALVASRRIEFPVARNSFSAWKYSQVDCFLAISQAVRDRLVADRIPAAKITVVHEGVDVERIAALPHGNLHAALFLPTHSPIVGAIGALVAQKAHHTLVDAAAIAVKQVSDVRFVILGEGELRPQLEKQIKHLHLERHVFLAGFRPDVLELLKDIDVFALSSTHEGMCTSLVDAMAAGKAAVATAVGGVPEVLADGETGFLVQARDSEALAARIVQLLKDENLRARMGRAGLARARQRFTVERMVAETAAAYERTTKSLRARDAGVTSAT
ncbi:MAG TPA: glycosyltransferase [Vicinamibacterales bacterium]|nr:glycosyltransferase [Vicinamibacterales bacterium]